MTIAVQQQSNKRGGIEGAVFAAAGGPEPSEEMER